MSVVSRIAAILVIALIAAQSVWAFTMEPMSTLLAPSGPGSVATFRLKNDGVERVAVKLEVLTRELKEDWTEINAPVGSLFIVYPSRVMIEPGAMAAVKVQWRGSATLSSERCFRLRAEEIPLDAGGQKGSGIRVMFKYVASLYVGQSAFASNLGVSVIGMTSERGEKGFRVQVKNSGSKHVVAENIKVDASDEDGTVFSFDSDTLKDLDGRNYLPGAFRSVFLTDDRARPGRRYDARIAYEAEY